MAVFGPETAIYQKIISDYEEVKEGPASKEEALTTETPIEIKEAEADQVMTVKNERSLDVTEVEAHRNEMVESEKLTEAVEKEQAQLEVAAETEGPIEEDEE